MIRADEVNTRWWGAPVARVEDGAFFALDADERATQLAPYAWAEFRAPLGEEPDPWTLAATGFAAVDVQIGFRIALGPAGAPSAQALEVRSAAEASFDPGALAPAAFAHERFARLRGATPERLADRYVTWARQLAAEHPAAALQIARDGTPQGWFCARPQSERTIELTLAAVYADATTSGALLYEAALGAFAAMGYRVGTASFSVTNRAVHSIYSSLGARWTQSTGCWLWQAEQA